MKREREVGGQNTSEKGGVGIHMDESKITTGSLVLNLVTLIIYLDKKDRI